MKTIHKFLLASLILLSLSGCINMQTALQRESVPPFKRILVVTQTRMPQDLYATSFLRAFPTDYGVCTVALSQLSFNENDRIHKEAVQCKSDVILTVRTVYAANVNPFSPNGTGMSQHNLELRTVGSDKPFWKAIVSSHPFYGELLPSRTVVRRLLQDRILQGKLPKVPQPGDGSLATSANE